MSSILPEAQTHNSKFHFDTHKRVSQEYNRSLLNIKCTIVMTIQVKFFASLKEQLQLSDTQIDHADTVEQVWNTATQQADRPDNIIVAVNLEYAQFDSPVNAGDEVAFFPPVTGG